MIYKDIINILAYPYKFIHGFIERKYYERIYKYNIQLHEEPEKQSDDYVATSNVNVALDFDKARELMNKVKIDHEPQYLGTCVAHTIKNAARYAIKNAVGSNIDLSEFDIYIDRETIHLGVDAGMYPKYALERVAKKGIAHLGVVPRARTIDELKQLTRERYPDEILNNYRVNPFAKSITKPIVYVSNKYSFNILWNYIQNEFAKGYVRPFQLSIKSYQGFWGTDFPKATGKILGGHSILGITIPVIYNNERGFFVIDSSYLRGTLWTIARGVRFISEKEFHKLATAARTIEFKREILEKLKIVEPIKIEKRKKQVSDVIFVDKPAKFGDKGDHVANIQKALMMLGYDIPSIRKGLAKPGYYGEETRKAVLAFHVSNWQKIHEFDNRWTYINLISLQGKHFGKLSVIVINNLLRDKGLI